MKAIQWTVALGALLLANGIQAAVIYAQTPKPTTTVASDTGLTLTASLFTLGAGDTARSVRWRGAGDINVNTFTITFYSDSGGNVGSSLGTFSIGLPPIRFDTGTPSPGGGNILEYAADLSGGVVLPTGNVWITIFDNAAANGPSWSWVATPDTYTIANSTDGGASWSTNPNQRNLYFIVDNTYVTPIPAAVWLLGSALGLLGWIRSRSSP